jgi:hypothetical protein
VTKKAYYDAKRAEIMAELRRRADNPHCDSIVRWWEYRYRYGMKMGPKMMAECGRLLGIPVWTKPTIAEVAPYPMPSRSIMFWRPWGTIVT